MRHPRYRRLNCERGDACTRPPFLLMDRDSETHQAGHKLLPIERVSIAADCDEFFEQFGLVDQRILGQTLKRHLTKNEIAFGGWHQGQKQFSARGAIGRDLRSLLKCDPQRPIRFDAVQIGYLRSVEHGQIAGFADLFDDASKYFMPYRTARLIPKDLERKLGCTRSQLKPSAIGRPLEKSCGFEGDEPAMRRRLRRAKSPARPRLRLPAGTSGFADPP